MGDEQTTYARWPTTSVMNVFAAALCPLLSKFFLKMTSTANDVRISVTKYVNRMNTHQKWDGKLPWLARMMDTCAIGGDYKTLNT